MSSVSAVACLHFSHTSASSLPLLRLRPPAIKSCDSSSLSSDGACLFPSTSPVILSDDIGGRNFKKFQEGTDFPPRFLDLNEKYPVLRTLDLKGVQPPLLKPKSLKRLRRRLSADTQIIKTDGSPSMEETLYLAVSVSADYHFSKVYYCKEDEACLYQSLAFDVSFEQGELQSAPAEIKLAYAITPKVASVTTSKELKRNKWSHRSRET